MGHPVPVGVSDMANPREHEDWFAWFVVLFCVVAIVSLVLASKARAHDDYPPECCGGMDCAPAQSVVLNHDGSLSVQTMHGVADFEASFPRRDSHDGRVHACFVRTDGVVVKYCLLLPPAT